jgi:hypothetical protein
MTRTASAAAHVLTSILFFAGVPGCVIVGALTNKIIPEAPVPARYVPAKDKPMLVLVENYRNPGAAGLDAQRVALHVAEALRRYRVAPVVDPDAAESLRSRDDYHAMKVQDVGRAAGAQQVLYVNLQQFALDNTVGGEMVKGRAELRVRVVDVATGNTLWPRDTPEGAAVTAESPWSRTAGGAAQGTPEPALRDEVARSAADQIVKLFRKWRPEDEGQDLGENVR